MAILNKDGKEVTTYEELKKAAIEAGINENKFIDRAPANMPTNGEFVDFEIDKNKENPEFNHLRMIVKDNKGKESKISVGRLLAWGKEKKGEQVLTIGDIRESQKGKFYIQGETINPELSTDQAKTVLELIGKKFRSKKIELFNLPFEQDKINSKEDAINAAGTTNAFKVTLLD